MSLEQAGRMTACQSSTFNCGAGESHGRDPEVAGDGEKT
jgi:hypothetical protein